jgi:HD-like signal output (HDOD) protein
MNPAELERITKAVPSLPEVVVQLQKEISNPNCSPASLEKILEKDQALTAKVLRLANSALFGCSFRVDSVSTALTMIGLGPLRDIAMGAAIARAFRGVDPNVLNMRHFWKHSVACAIACRVLLAQMNDRSPERLFSAGLLHDIGRLVLILLMPAKVAEVSRTLRTASGPVLETEQKILQTTHCEVGAQALRLWKLPPSLCDIVKLHHHPELARTAALDTSVLHIADFLVETMGAGHDGEGLMRPSQGAQWSDVVGRRVVIRTVIEQVNAQLDEITSMLFS